MPLYTESVEGICGRFLLPAKSRLGVERPDSLDRMKGNTPKWLFGFHMKEIPLTRGYVALVDDDDYERVSVYKWHVDSRGMRQNTVYATRALPAPDRKKSQQLHRLIMNAPADLDVDHIDGNGLNCQKSNMRLATAAQNSHNRKKNRNNTSGYKGVHWVESRKKWRSEIKIQNKKISLGNFSDVLDAAKAYQDAAIKYHGDFARFDVAPKDK